MVLYDCREIKRHPIMRRVWKLSQENRRTNENFKEGHDIMRMVFENDRWCVGR